MKKKAIHNRIYLIFGFLLLLPVAIGFQIFRIQYWNGDHLRALWNQQAIDYIPVPAQRGYIYDRNGRLLASNSVAYNVAVDPGLPSMTEATIDTLCRILAHYTSRSANQYKRKIATAPKGSRYVILAQNLDTRAYEELYSLNAKGIILEEKFKRVYNLGTLAAQTLGYLNYKKQGMIGLEAYYDDKLRGRDGLQQVRRDKRGNIYAYVGAPKKQPVDGYSLYTTLDTHIQSIVEEELRAGVKRTSARYGTAIVLEPETGAVRALANYPTFNPNNPGSRDNENRRNYAISDQIEPGSTFKLVTAVAAVDQQKVTFDEVITTPDDGRYQLHDLTLRDHDPLGDLTFKEVIQKSSNIATAKIATRLSKDTYYQYVRNMGFGTPTNIDLPNEASGVLKKPYEWSLVTLPWMSYGYEIQVTPLQIAQAYATFANQGKMMRPYLVEKIVDEEGHIVEDYRPLQVRKVASKETFKKLLPIFESVLADSGTAPWAAVKGLSIAGKTGTAQKVKNGRYTSSYRASFVGFFPSDNPQYVCLILLDEPETSFYGGVTAGPIFKNITSRLVSLSDDIEIRRPEENQIAKNETVVPLVTGLSVKEAKALLNIHNIIFSIRGEGSRVVSQSVETGTNISPGDKLILDTEAKFRNGNYIRVPTLTGMSAGKAVWLLNSLGLNTKLIHSGTIIAQFPEPGAHMHKGGSVTLRGNIPKHQHLTYATTNTN